MRADAAQRLAESFETALRLAGGIAALAFLDEPKRAELVFSSTSRLPGLRLSRAELEPQAVLVQQPGRRVPDAATAWACKQFFDPPRVVAHPHLSLAGGAVRGWDRRNAYYFQLIQSLARHYGFDVETPWTRPARAGAARCCCTAAARSVIEFRYRDGSGGTTRKRHPFEGILPNLERRYRETDSPMVREELAKYLGMRPCPRLRRHAPEPRGALRVRRRAQPRRGQRT